MRYLISTPEVKKIFLFVIIFIFVTGCSQVKSLFGPSDNESDSSSVNNQLEEEFGGEDASDIFDDFKKQVKEDLKELDEQIEDQNMQDAINDFEEQLQNDINELDEKINEENMRDVLDDFEAQLETDLNELDSKNDGLDMQDAMDDFVADLQHDYDMLDEKLEDYFMKDAMRNFEKQVEEDLVDGKEKEERRGGSCNAIAKTSTCIDYIGSFWTETQMRYSCSYSGIFSFDSCESGSIGGCQVGKGSFNDMIIWMYPHGGSPIATDTVKSAKPACDMNPMGSWVNAR